MTKNGTEIDVDDARIEEWEKFRGPSSMQVALAEAGLTPAVAAAKLAEELEATHVKAQVVESDELVNGADGMPVRLTTRDWSYSRPMIDWGTRQRARESLVKMWDGMPGKQQEDAGSGPVVVELRE